MTAIALAGTNDNIRRIMAGRPHGSIKSSMRDNAAPMRWIQVRLHTPARTDSTSRQIELSFSFDATRNLFQEHF
jgi:hypothetical protein